MSSRRDPKGSCRRQIQVENMPGLEAVIPRVSVEQLAIASVTSGKLSLPVDKLWTIEATIKIGGISFWNQ
jgi:hypothetical protein